MSKRKETQTLCSEVEVSVCQVDWHWQSCHSGKLTFEYCHQSKLCWNRCLAQVTFLLVRTRFCHRLSTHLFWIGRLGHSSGTNNHLLPRCLALISSFWWCLRCLFGVGLSALLWNDCKRSRICLKCLEFRRERTKTPFLSRQLKGLELKLWLIGPSWSPVCFGKSSFCQLDYPLFALYYDRVSQLQTLWSLGNP